MRYLKTLGALGLALALAAIGGYVWGARGASPARASLAASGLRLHVATARVSLLQARVDLFESNFGDAARSLEAARADLVTLEGAFSAASLTAAVEAVRKAVAAVGDAQQRAARLDVGAHASVSRAVAALDAATASAEASRNP